MFTKGSCLPVARGWAALLLLASLSVLLGGVTSPAGAQLPPPAPGEVERQETLLPDAGILEITPELRRRLGLFTDITDFRSARLFRSDQGDAVVEIEWMEGDRRVRQRRRLEPSELMALQGALEEALVQAGSRAVATREGRGGLVLGHTLLGLGYHGWAVPVALDISSSQGAVASYLLTAGTAFYLPYALTRGRGVSDAHRGLSLYGGTRGIVAGLLAGDLAAGDREDGSGSGRARLGGGVLGGALGGVLGFVAVDHWAPRQGDAEFWGALGDAGLLAGAAVGYLAGPYKDETVVERVGEFEYTTTRTRNRRAGHALTLAGHAGGLVVGGWLSGRRDYATGDVSVLRSATVLGIQTGATVARVAGADEEGEPWVTGMLAGGVVGLVAGDRWIGPRGLGTGEGLLVNAGHLAGAATAAGITYLLVDDIGDNLTALLTASTLGGVLGAGLVWNAVHEGSSRSEGRAGGGLSSILEPWAVEFHPVGVLQGTLPALGRDLAGGTWGGTHAIGRATSPPAWLTLRF
jgi:hypothetical protein